MDLQHIFFGFSSNLPLDSKPGNDRVSGRQGHSFSANQMPLETSPLQNLNGPCHYMTSSSDQATTVSCDTQRCTQNLLKAMKKSMFNWIQWNSQSHMRALLAGLIRWRIFMIKYSRARDLNEEETSCRPRDIVGDGIWVSYKIIGWVWTKWKYKIISGVMLSANRQATTSQSLKLLSLEGHTMMPNELILHWHAGQELFAIYLANDLPPHGLQCNNTYHLESPRDGQTSKIFQLVKINPTLTLFLQSHMPTTWISEKPSCSAHQSAGPQTCHWDSTAAQVAQNHAASRLPSDPRPAFTFGQGNGENKWGFISHEASWYCKGNITPLSNALCFPNWMARNFITWWSSKWSHMTLKPPSILSICILLAFPILQNQKHPKLRKQTLPNNSLRPTLNMFRELLSVLLDSETIVFIGNLAHAQINLQGQKNMPWKMFPFLYLLFQID